MSMVCVAAAPSAPPRARARQGPTGRPQSDRSRQTTRGTRRRRRCRRLCEGAPAFRLRSRPLGRASEFGPTVRPAGHAPVRPTAPARRRGPPAIRPSDAVDPARPTTAAAAGRPHTLDAIRGGRPPGRRPAPASPGAPPRPPPPSRRNTRDSLPSRNAVTRRKNGGSSHPTITHFVIVASSTKFRREQSLDESLFLSTESSSFTESFNSCCRKLSENRCNYN